MQGQPANHDQKLVAKAVAGDRHAFTQLVEPLIPRLMSTAQRMLGLRDEAEDAVQSALASAWVARAKIHPARPILPFLTTITLNKCRDRLRRKKVAWFVSFGTVAMPEFALDTSPSPETEALDRQLLQKTQAEIQRLPMRLREALILVAIDGQSQREVADLLGISEKAVESLVYRARKTLREKILNE